MRRRRAQNQPISTASGVNVSASLVRSGNVSWNEAPPSGEAATATRPLCVTTSFCTMARPRPVPRDARGEERLEDLRARLLGHARAVVVDHDAAGRARPSCPEHRDVRWHAGRLAGLDGVANQIAEHLPQQHLVAVDDAELAA